MTCGISTRLNPAFAMPEEIPLLFATDLVINQ